MENLRVYKDKDDICFQSSNEKGEVTVIKKSSTLEAYILCELLRGMLDIDKAVSEIKKKLSLLGSHAATKERELTSDEVAELKRLGNYNPLSA